MIDFHSHILPYIDDGSENVEESIKLLRMLAEQGVDTVCATSHFYPSEDSPNNFLGIRKKVYKKLKIALPKDESFPKIILGAEVAYFPGISKMEALPLMRFEGTKVLLLEMPIIKWSDYTVREIIDISCSGNIKVVLAHIERYTKKQRRVVWDALRESGVLMQVNATYFTNPKTRRKALKQLQRGEIHLIGSDCHNSSERAPQIAQAVQIIEGKLGKSELEMMDVLGRKLLL